MMNAREHFRAWRPDEWFDRGFLDHVPAAARDSVMQNVRPLSHVLHEQVHSALFAGIKQPFHYVRATGWMRRLLRKELALPKTSSFGDRATYLEQKLAWTEDDIVLLIYHQPTSYATLWSIFLKYLRKEFLNLDTMLVCHTKTQETALFWEDHGPVVGKRGRRELPCPCWDKSG